jgi:hypothetical protein
MTRCHVQLAPRRRHTRPYLLHDQNEIADKSAGRFHVISRSWRGQLRSCLSPVACRVIATCRNPATAPELQALKQQHGDRITLARMDVTKPDEITACADQFNKELPYLNLLFNVTGLLHIPGARARPGLVFATHGDGLRCFSRAGSVRLKACGLCTQMRKEEELM